MCLVSLVGLLFFTARGSAQTPGEDGWKPLFDGETLKGWKASEDPESWKVDGGAIVANGKPRSHLFYVGDDKPFENFELKVDVLTEEKANGGIYFHTQWQETGWPKFGYEVQVNNTHRDPIKTGSLYQVANVTEAPAKDGGWFNVHVIVKSPQIVVKVDGKTVVDFTEEPDRKPGDDFTRKLDRGTFCLQAHDPDSVVRFKNLQVKRLD
jgi:hypothetical protein